jgi:SAM-dependent methyltransferase
VTAPLPAPPLEATAFKCTCADWWGHPAVQLLVGDALRPGGTALTAAYVDRLALTAGSRALDIGSATGATLELLTRRGLLATGIDYSEVLATQAARCGPVAVGDGEQLPFATESFDLVTIECVLSALPDKHAALREIARVLPPGGTLLLTDMTVSGPLPEPLDALLAWVACAAGALSIPRYRDLLRGHGFEISVVEDHRSALAAFVAKARRRLALVDGAIRLGLVPDPEAMLGPELDALQPAGRTGDDLAAFGRDVLAQVAQAVRSGQLGYGAFVAQRT